MSLDHPVASRYLDSLNASLSSLSPVDRQEIVAEIGQHIRDSVASGKPLDEVLVSLGPVEQLARAYQVELLVNPRQVGHGWMSRGISLLGLVIMGSLPTFLITVVLGAVGFSFSISGIAVFSACLFLLMGGVLPPGVHVEGDPWLGIAIGPLLTAGGALCLWLLYHYIRFVIRLIVMVTRPERT